MPDAHKTIPAPSMPMTAVRLQPSDIADAKPLLGFDLGPNVFHVLAFDFGNDGGAIGIWREGDEFCARITLDALAEFWANAKAAGAIANAASVDPGRDRR
ncbi:hypothetical protein ACSFA0_23395 [Variovorax sp. LT1P1]|uniref:hypothetical protein n=1 Tax=Variovorax sp. LT1P1 TaxID=3443730 RepID=UPI003F452AA0